MLNANVAFLAIQSIDSSGSAGKRSNPQRASYLSVANSVGAIVLGLLLVREHNTSSSVRQLFSDDWLIQLTHAVASLFIFYLDG